MRCCVVGIGPNGHIRKHPGLPHIVKSTIDYGVSLAFDPHMIRYDDSRVTTAATLYAARPCCQAHAECLIGNRPQLAQDVMYRLRLQFSTIRRTPLIAICNRPCTNSSNVTTCNRGCTQYLGLQQDCVHVRATGRHPTTRHHDQHVQQYVRATFVLMSHTYSCTQCVVRQL